ncbi:MAG: glycosyltransferase [Bacteroidetes bacterium]|nr:glycosyltransferase [Bacteroidota bacterium]
MVTLYFVFFLFLIYLLLILVFTAGWLKISWSRGSVVQWSGGLVVPRTKITLIIPFRNEEFSIIPCLEDIIQQDYPHHLMEVYLADDQSDDNSATLVSGFISAHPGFNLNYLKVESDPGKANKKLAIEQAIARSSGELIIMTDADTRFSKDRIRLIAGNYENTRAKMILAPVEFSPGKSLFSRMQSLEFIGLMGVTAGSCGAGYPIMCNGANLAFEKSAFVQVNGFSDNRGFSSGDDLFLLLKFRKKFGRKSVLFAKSKDAMVSTAPQKTFRDFLRQRLRWVSKSKGYKDTWILFVAIITYMANLSLAGLLVYGIFNVHVLWIALILLCLKMIIEFPLILMSCRFHGKTSLLLFYPWVQVVNIFYVSLVGLLGNFVPYSWKGRKLRS